MAYIFMYSVQIIVQLTILDFIQERTNDIIDLKDSKGRAIYEKIYGRKLSNNFSYFSNDVEEERRDFEKISTHIDEKSRRLFAGHLAKRKGIHKVQEITSLDRKTIQRGINEIDTGNIIPKGNIRKSGGGRPNFDTSEPRFLAELEKLIENDIAGDPMTTKIWTRKTLRWCKKKLKEKKIDVSISTIRKGFKKLGISLRKNKKYINNRNHPDRGAQFDNIINLREEHNKIGAPTISVDGKKKEKIGNFKNAGRKWGKSPKKVLDHDFLSEAEGKLIPYGIYDPKHNKGYVYCGKSRDTPEFAVDAIVWWWENYGRKNYQNVKKLLILADCGGSNGYRPYKWKYDLQNRFADEFNIEVTVAHYPSGTSKYNPIEHKLFSFISINWAGEPLTSYEKALGFIQTTHTKEGLRVFATLTNKVYEKGLTISKEEMGLLNITRGEICPLWNYTFNPR